MLFGSLNASIFMIFSGENRLLYEEVLVRIYDGCFGSDLLFPSQNELVGLIYDVLAARPDLWHDDGEQVVLDEISSRGRRLRPRNKPQSDALATSDAMARARHVYSRLLETGWLEESRYGLRVTVDMPAGAMRLAEFLSQLRAGTTEQLGGLVIEVKNALDAVRISASQNALGLHKAARDAIGFGRYLRSVLSSLREIDKQVLASETLNERLQRYFEDFVERVLLRDYATISTTAHPYRFRFAILDALQAVEDSEIDVVHLSTAYHEAHLAQSEALARDLVFDDLDKIRRVFQRIDDAFQRIQMHRTQLEVRLRNTVRYAGRRADAYLRRSAEIMSRLDRLAEHAGRSGAQISVEGNLELVRYPYSMSLLARPRGDRPVVEALPVELAVPDPVHLLRRQLEGEFLDRVTVTPRKVTSFLEARLKGGDSVRASSLEIFNLDDFLAFETLRRAVRSVLKNEPDDQVSNMLSEGYEFELVGDGAVDNDWVACEDFRIRRLDGQLEIGVHHAG